MPVADYHVERQTVLALQHIGAHELCPMDEDALERPILDRSDNTRSLLGDEERSAPGGCARRGVPWSRSAPLEQLLRPRREGREDVSTEVEVPLRFQQSQEYI